MPLNSLRESIETLTTLVHQARRLRQQPDLSPDALDRVDEMVDETIQTMRGLMDVLNNAYEHGDLNATVKKDREDPLPDDQQDGA